jgi:hypothetical protein
MAHARTHAPARPDAVRPHAAPPPRMRSCSGRRPAREESGARGSVAQHGRLDPVLEQLRAHAADPSALVTAQRPSALSHLRRDWIAPPTSSPGPGPPRPHLHRDRAPPAHICAGTGPTPPTSSPGPGPPRPHLHRDRAHPAHIFTGTGPTPPTAARDPGPTWPPAYETMMPAMRATHEHEPIACRTPHALQRARACCNGTTQCVPFPAAARRAAAARRGRAALRQSARRALRPLSLGPFRPRKKRAGTNRRVRAQPEPRGASLYNASGSFG